MRYSKLLIPTLKEIPGDAELLSHRLMYRNGMIRKIAAGVYTFLPLGLRVLRKFENIVREEMNRAGAQELLMPIIQPKELWEETGRWDVYGDEMMKFNDRHDRIFGLGPTHEEMITHIARCEIRSYRQLPMTLYQIQLKFRDEIRPRFGIMRGREFMMKDAYSFAADEQSAKDCYDKMTRAYHRILERTGLQYKVVEADPGDIGGSLSHEFMITANAGEEVIGICNKCSYAANVDTFEIKTAVRESSLPDDAPSMEKVPTPGKHTVEEVASFLEVEPGQLIKTLIYSVDNTPVAVLVRGNHTLNETKLKNFLKAKLVYMADAGTIQKVTCAPVGFSGPAGLKEDIPVYADNALIDAYDMVTGANEKDSHYRHIYNGRDYKVTKYADLRCVEESDSCPRCGSSVEFMHGIEIGHTFHLGTKYSGAMQAVFSDKSGEVRPFVMGCYGIGVSRMAAAAIEQCGDDKKMVWPTALSPYQVHIIPLDINDEKLFETAVDIEKKLEDEGVEVLLDDRDARAGVKFSDADLIGVPLRVVLGKRTFKEDMLEIKWMPDDSTEKAPINEAVDKLLKMIKRNKCGWG